MQLSSLQGDSLLLGNLDNAVEQDGEIRHNVWMSHGDKVTQLPEGFSVIATTESAPIAAMADEKRRFYGIQFHPEVTHTPAGPEHFESLCARYL